MKIIKCNRAMVDRIRLFIIIMMLEALFASISYAHISIRPSGPYPEGPFPPEPPCETGQCCDKAGSNKKIVFQSGEETFRVTDLVVNDVMPIRVTRTYSSNTLYDSPLGYGWAFDFDKRLFEYPDNSIVIRHGCGNLNRYIFTGGTYQPASGSQNNKLVKNADNSFTVNYLNGEKDHFDTQGRLMSSVDVRGNQLVFSYDPGGKLPLIGGSPKTRDPLIPIVVAYVHRLTQIQIKLADASLGGSVAINYNETTGRVSSIVANDGRTITYHHDITVDNLTIGDLVQVDGLETNVSIYGYGTNGEHDIRRIQEGLTATPVVIGYGSAEFSELATLEKYGDHRVEFDFSLRPFQTTVSDPNGSSFATYVYQFNDVGFVEFIRNAEGNETRYTLDGFGNKLKEQIYQGSELTGVLLKQIDRTFDSNSNPLTETSTLQSGETITKTITYDGMLKASETIVSSLALLKQFKTQWLYNHDSNGNATTVQEERRFKDNGIDYLSTSYIYNTHGNILTTTLPDGHVIENEYGALYGGRYITKTYHRIAGVAVTDLQETYTYDNQGNRTTVTDAKNHITTTVYDDLNRRKKVTNHLGHVTSFVYDDRNNITHIIRDRSVANDQLDITRLTYDGKSLLTFVERTDASGAFVILRTNVYNSVGKLLSTTNSLEQTSTFGYDLLKRVNSITNYKDETISYSLDALDNRTHEEIKDSNGVVVRRRDATFDALNRQLTQIGATNNQTTTYTYDAVGNRDTLTDALSRPATVYTYDTLSRLSNVLDANNKNTLYSYYDRGWLNTVTDPKGLITTYNYNELGQIDNLVSPDTGTTNYTYDLAGNRETKKDARNITATYGYDVLNRLSSITYPNATQNISFTYDEGINGLGKQTSMTDETGSTQYEYNQWGDLIKETKLINGLTFVTQYGYDTEHRLVGIIYPSGRIVTHTPDINQDITSISSTYQAVIQPLLENIVYMPFGGIDTASFGNGLTLNNDYDLDYRLVLQQAGMVYDRTTIYNDVNNITGITNNRDAAKSQSFIYENLDRLTDAAGIYGSGHYEYDEDGNRILETKNTTQTSIYNYPTTSNKLSDITGVKANGYGYDLNGNTTSKSGMIFTYDQTNRMSQAENGTVTADYKYDGKGQRAVKEVDGITTIFIFDKGGKLIAEADATGVVQKDYVYYGNLPVTLATNTGAPAVYYYHNDHLGTPQVMTDQSQMIAWSGDYEAFGEVEVGASTVDSSLRFPGQYFDQETNLYYNYFRDYDPSIGRYITSDPIGLRGGINTYTYVENNPLNWIDPFGLVGIASRAATIPVVPPGGSTATFPSLPSISDAITNAGRTLACVKYRMCNLNEAADEKKRKNCQALKNSILNTCAGLCGKKKFKCFAAADKSFRQCMGYE